MITAINNLSNNRLCLPLFQRFRVFMRKTELYIILYVPSIENIVLCRKNII